MYRCTYGWGTINKLSSSICYEKRLRLPNKYSRHQQLTRGNNITSRTLTSLSTSIGSNRFTYDWGHHEQKICTSHEMSLTTFRVMPVKSSIDSWLQQQTRGNSTTTTYYNMILQLLLLDCTTTTTTVNTSTTTATATTTTVNATITPTTTATTC